MPYIFKAKVIKPTIYSIPYSISKTNQKYQYKENPILEYVSIQPTYTSLIPIPLAIVKNAIKINKTYIL